MATVSRPRHVEPKHREFVMLTKEEILKISPILCTAEKLLED